MGTMTEGAGGALLELRGSDIFWKCIGCSVEEHGAFGGVKVLECLSQWTEPLS